MITPRRIATCVAVLQVVGLTTGCRARSAETPTVLRLVDLFNPKGLEGATVAARQVPRIEWQFGAPAPSPAPKVFPATRGWQAGPDVGALAIREGRLEGRSSGDFPILRMERTSGLDDPDQLHAIEIRLRVSAGTNLSVATSASEKVDLAEQQERGRKIPWIITTPVVAGKDFQTYTLTSPGPLPLSRLRHLMVRPTDAAQASFALESVRLVSRKEHLGGIASGVGWQGLNEIYRECLVARDPQKLSFSLRVPEHPRLDLAIGSIEDAPIRFRVSAGTEGGAAPQVLLEDTVTTPFRWELRSLDLSPLAGRDVTLSLALESSQEGAIGFWGSPVVRSRPASQAASQPASKGPGAARVPRGVIVVQADTLRRDDLDVYGHSRETAPTIRRLASEGALFRHAVAQAPWTKVSTPSIMTSLYPTTHGVHRIPDRLPASATTMAEVFRAAGHATLQLSSNSFTGVLTNLHQGFEELHESGSLSGRAGPHASKTAREYVDRLTEWLERHRDEPFFVFLHINDPHAPYEPRSPYNTLWNEAGASDTHKQDVDRLARFISAPGFKRMGMATPAEVAAAGLDAGAYLGRVRGWYDGSIRGLDTEMGRLLERLRTLGLDEQTLLVFLSDHGEEFHEHGGMWHGQSVHGELTNVPLIMRWPGGLKAGTVVEEPVQLIDVMPTVVDLSGLPPPPKMQGRSLAPLVAAGDADGAARTKRGAPPAISERPVPEALEDDPPVTESYAITIGEWKLVHNRTRKPAAPEFELYDVRTDPREQSNVAPANPEVVGRLAKALDGWHKMALAARLEPDGEAAQGMTAEQLERLRSLGYVR
jgi:arylsulfatase A-like enzyme